MVFMPFCYAEAAANLLTILALDPVFGKNTRMQVLAVRARARRGAKRAERCDLRHNRRAASLYIAPIRGGGQSSSIS